MQLMGPVVLHLLLRWMWCAAIARHAPPPPCVLGACFGTQGWLAGVWLSALSELWALRPMGLDWAAWRPSAMVGSVGQGKQLWGPLCMGLWGTGIQVHPWAWPWGHPLSAWWGSLDV